MRTLTLTQPYASLVAIGAKRIETRSWSTSYRGPLGIHAAKGFPGWAKGLCESRMFCNALGWPVCPSELTQEWLDDNAARIKSLPRGTVVATARLVKCVPVELLGTIIQPFTEQEQAFGNYEPGRYAWLLEDVRQLPEPVPAKGALGLWEWSQSAS